MHRLAMPLTRPPGGRKAERRPHPAPLCLHRGIMINDGSESAVDGGGLAVGGAVGQVAGAGRGAVHNTGSAGSADGGLPATCDPQCAEGVQGAGGLEKSLNKDSPTKTLAATGGEARQGSAESALVGLPGGSGMLHGCGRSSATRTPLSVAEVSVAAHPEPNQLRI